MSTHIRFYFDYLSPYAYVNWVNLQRLLREYAGQLTVSYHPISFPALVGAWGSTVASKIPPKTKFIFKDVYRTTVMRHMPFSVPPKWPFKSRLLLCLSLPSVGGIDQERIISAIWSAIWGNNRGQGTDLEDEKELLRLLSDLGLDAEGLLTFANSELIKKELIDSTIEAAEKYEVFGVPTMIVQTSHSQDRTESELYFGNDQILTIRNLLDGGPELMRSAPEPLLEFIRNVPQRKLDWSSRINGTNQNRPQAKL